VGPFLLIGLVVNTGACDRNQLKPQRGASNQSDSILPWLYCSCVVPCSARSGPHLLFLLARLVPAGPRSYDTSFHLEAHSLASLPAASTTFSPGLWSRVITTIG